MTFLIFCFREYPCDHVAMLNLAILNVGNPRIQTHETAVQLLHLLDRRFFQEPCVLSDNLEEHLPLNDVFLSVSYCRSQMYLSDELARLHPDLTMPIFSGRVYILNLDNFLCFYCRLPTFFKIIFPKKSFGNTIRVSNSPDLGPNCLQRLSAEDKSCH